MGNCWCFKCKLFILNTFKFIENNVKIVVSIYPVSSVLYMNEGSRVFHLKICLLGYLLFQAVFFKKQRLIKKLLNLPLTCLTDFQDSKSCSKDGSYSLSIIIQTKCGRQGETKQSLFIRLLLCSIVSGWLKWNLFTTHLLFLIYL